MSNPQYEPPRKRVLMPFDEEMQEFYDQGIEAIEASLANHLAFADFLDKRDNNGSKIND